MRWICVEIKKIILSDSKQVKPAKIKKAAGVPEPGDQLSCHRAKPGPARKQGNPAGGRHAGHHVIKRRKADVNSLVVRGSRLVTTKGRGAAAFHDGRKPVLGRDQVRGRRIRQGRARQDCQHDQAQRPNTRLIQSDPSSYNCILAIR